MADPDDEQRLLQSVAIQNANAILVARQHAEQELVKARDALELKTRALAQSLARMRATLEASTDGILVTDEDGNVTDFNERYLSLWRLPRELIAVGRHQRIIEAIAGQFADARAFRHRIDAIYSSSPEETSDVLELADGRVIERFSRVQMVDGRRAGRVWTFRDVTERRRDEQVSALLSAIIGSSDDAIISKNLDSIITSWNTAAERMFGYSAAEAVGQSITMLIPPERLDEEPRIIEQLKRGERVEHFETIRMRKDGSRLDISLTISPVKDAQGRVVGASKIARDITQRKRAEEALRQSHANLRDSEERLRELDRRKDEFLAMLGHELRNPLGTISNAVRLLANVARRDATATRAHAVIDRQVGHLARLVDDLLDLGRVTAGKITLVRRPVELAELTAGIIRAWRESGQLDRHQVKAQLTSVWVEADPVRLEQIITNLLGNALKYTPASGSVTVRVDAESSEALLEVEDTGIGMTAELVGLVFDLFAQGPQSPDRSQGGLGIGLTLVRRLAEHHGGTVTARSAGPGRGSKFTVRLPAIERPLQPEPSATRPRAATPLRILLVEDNDDAREMLQFMLEREGHTVVAASDGPRAVELATSAAPDVGIIDIGLPGLDGFEVARRIRTATGSRSLLIALTGYGDADARGQAAQAGFDAHLVKPMDPAQLAALLAGTARRS